MSFPYAKDTELKWALIAFLRYLKALLDVPEQFDSPKAGDALKELTVVFQGYAAEARREDHVDTRTMYYSILDEISEVFTSLSLLYCTFALKAIEGEMADHPAVEQLKRARMLLATGDIEGLSALMDEIRGPIDPITTN